MAAPGSSTVRAPNRPGPPVSSVSLDVQAIVETRSCRTATFPPSHPAKRDKRAIPIVNSHPPLSSTSNVLGEQRGAELLEPRRRVVEHRKDRGPIGMLQRHLGLHRHQRVHDPISLLVQIGTAQSNDQRKQRLFGELDSGKTHHQSTSSVGSSGFRAPPRDLSSAGSPRTGSPLCSRWASHCRNPELPSARIPREASRQTRAHDRLELRHLAADASDALLEQYGAKLDERLRRRIVQRAEDRFPFLYLEGEDAGAADVRFQFLGECLVVDQMVRSSRSGLGLGRASLRTSSLPPCYPEIGAKGHRRPAETLSDPRCLGSCLCG